MTGPAKSRAAAGKQVSRRQVLLGIPAVMAVSRLLVRGGQAAGPPLPVLRLHGLGIRVSDPARSLDFYRGLFGMPIQAERDNATSLRVGDGPQFLSVSPTADGEAPNISHICMSVPDFDVDGLLRSLSELGITRIEPPGAGSRGIDRAMRSWVRMEDGGTPEVYFADARGLVIQLQDASYCGGTGPLGNVCLPQTAEPTGDISLGDLNHFTVFVSDGPGAISFYQDAMGLAPQAYQATTPALGLGDGIQFLMFAGGGGGRGRGGGAETPTPANIHHASFNMEGFDTGEIRRTLTDHGLSASDGNTGPLVHYISLRMPNRGGAEGGTPELYFTDPDGLLMQIQDSSYCGGGGILGNICEA